MGYMDPSAPRIAYDFDREVDRLLSLINGVDREQGRIALKNELRLVYHRGRADILGEQRGRRHA